MDENGLKRQEYLPFTPSGPDEWLKQTFDDTPRYLFRVSAPKADGETSPSWAKSKDAQADRASSTRDVFSRNSHHVASMLNRHFERKKNVKFDNFVSWTSSLLFALQDMFYRHQEDRSALENIYLYIVDTTQFPKGVFVRDMDLISIYSSSHEGLQDLERVRGLPSDPESSCADYLRCFYFGEYLSQGALKIERRCGVVSAQKIIDQGLFSLRAEFKGSKRFNLGLESRVMQLRKAFDSSHREQRRELEQEIQAAVAIADLFGPPWRVPMAAGLMGLRPCQRLHVDIVCEKLRKAFPELASRGNSGPHKDLPFKRLLPEVQQFEVILNALDEHIRHDAS